MALFSYTSTSCTVATVSHPTPQGLGAANSYLFTGESKGWQSSSLCCSLLFLFFFRMELVSLKPGAVWSSAIPSSSFLAATFACTEDMLPFSFRCLFFLGGLESQVLAALSSVMPGLQRVPCSSPERLCFLFLFLELAKKGPLALSESKWLHAPLGIAGGSRGAAEGQHDLKLDEGVTLAKVLLAECGGAEDLEAGESTL